MSPQLAVALPPFEISGFDLKVYWHRRFDNEPRNRWLREQLIGLFGKDARPRSRQQPRGREARPKGRARHVRRRRSIRIEFLNAGVVLTGGGVLPEQLAALISVGHRGTRAEHRRVGRPRQRVAATRVIGSLLGGSGGAHDGRALSGWSIRIICISLGDMSDNRAGGAGIRLANRRYRT
jgi:hypothetical protein